MFFQLELTSYGYSSARLLASELMVLHLSTLAPWRVNAFLHSSEPYVCPTLCANPSHSNTYRSAKTDMWGSEDLYTWKADTAGPPAIPHTKKTTAQHHHARTACRIIDLTTAERQPGALIELQLELLHLHAVLGNLANLHVVTGVDVALPS